MSEHVVSDFKGKDELLIQSIDSLLAMDAKGILVPHGIGGHARTLLLAAKAAIEQACADRTVPDGFVVVPVELLQLIQCDVENSADWLSSATSALRNLLSAAPEPKK